jgi:hypothetical protein
MAADDVDKIRQAVAGMTPSQLRQWLAQMKDLIDYVESPQWQETKAWLRGFLRVQAIYSDEEIAKLRTEVRNADANELMQIMKRIQAKHEQLVWMHQASQQTRSAEVAARNQSVARQAAATSSARASRTAGNLPLFGTGVAASSKPSKGYQPPGPLINSRQVAAATVWQEAGLGWGW